MKHLLTFLVLLAIVSGQLSAQRYAAQDGHLLDANNRIGSMGWNGNARMDALSYRNNNVMTGNITGGLSFQGKMSYSSSGTFQGLSQSDTLSNFRRDSVSVNRLGMSGPQAYFDQSRSVTGSYGGGISGSYQGYSTSRIINPGSSSRTTYTQQYNTSLNFRPQGTRSFSLDNYISSNPVSRNQFDRTSGPAGIASETLGRTSLGFSLTTNNESLPLSRKLNLKKEIVEKPDQTQLNIQTENYTETTTAYEEEPIDFEEQMYLDPDASRRIFNEGEMQSSGLIASEGLTEQMKAKYNEYIAAGRDYLKKGKFYHAIDSFELSKIYAGRKNLEPLYLCMAARFAAGEYISASSNVYQMFLISFDQTIQKRDIEDVFGEEGFVLESLIDIELRYNSSKNNSLLFLKGYIEYINNDLEEATLSFIKLVKNNPNNELFEKILANLRAQREAGKTK